MRSFNSLLLLSHLLPFSSLVSSNSIPSTRDISTLLSGGKSREGENHNSLVVPTGAGLRDIAVGDNGDQLLVFWGNQSDTNAKSAYIM